MALTLSLSLTLFLILLRTFTPSFPRSVFLSRCLGLSVYFCFSVSPRGGVAHSRAGNYKVVGSYLTSEALVIKSELGDINFLVYISQF